VKRYVILAIVLLVCIAPLFSSFAYAADEGTGGSNTGTNISEEKNNGSADGIEDKKIESNLGQNDEGDPPDILVTINNFFSFFALLLPYLLLLVVVLIALWVYFDASRRTNFGWVWGLASLLIIPWVVYLVWRPVLTIEEGKIVESDLRLRKIESEYYRYVLSKEKFICPVCGTPISEDYQVCPNCFKQLKAPCGNCGKLLNLEWKVCPYCAARVEAGQDE